MILEVAREKQKLDHVFDLVSHLHDEEEVLAHWAKYLCVLTSGFIENSLRNLLTHYSASRAASPVVNYVETRLKGLTNLNEERIAQLLGAFSPSWRHTFTKQLTDKQKGAIDSILSNRHLIVHGQSVGLTFSRMKTYYEEVIKVITLIDEKCVNAST